MLPDESTAREFLRRLGHPIAIVGQAPRDPPAKKTVVWPVDQHDATDVACALSCDFGRVFCNLNPLLPDIAAVRPVEEWASVRDSMIARRTRILIDIDGHGIPKETAREQKDAIKARLGAPLIETDSGRGYGLIYTCDLPNDRESTDRVKAFLLNLKADFPCVDSGVTNPGRLTRIIGTLNGSIPTRILND